MAERPLHLKIICVLGFISATAGLVGGLWLLMISSTVLAFLGPYSDVLMAIFAAATIISFASLIGYYWLWKMFRKGWIMILILMIIGIFLGIISLFLSGFSMDNLTTVLNMIYNIVVISYLLRKRTLFNQKNNERA